MRTTEQIKDEIIEKQNEIIRLLSLNDAFFNVRIAVLNEEVTVLKADLTSLEQELKECAIKDTKVQNDCNNCTFGICLTKDWPCAECDGNNKWEPIKPE